MAPEILRRDFYRGKEVDIFSLGVSLFWLVFGGFPFEEAKREDEIYAQLLAGDDEGFLNLIDPDHYMSSEFRDLIVKMLAFDSSRRPSVQ